MEGLCRAHAKVEFHTYGDSRFSRMWRGRIYTWSHRNQQWQVAKSYTEARVGKDLRSATPLGEEFAGK